MPSPVIQASFAGGELAPSLYGRVDLQRYGISLKTCRNFITRVYGGAMNRPGTRLLQAGKFNTGNVRLIPFVFNLDQAYVLELGDYYLRAYTDGAPLAGVTSKTNDGTMTPTQTGTGTFTIAASKDTFDSSYVGRKIQVLQANSDVYTITAVTNAKNVSATGTHSLTGVTTVATTKWRFVENPAGTLFETSTPWGSNDLDGLYFAQTADVVTVCHPNYPPHDIARQSDGTFAVYETQILGGPWLDTNTDQSLTINASATTGTITLTASRGFFTSAMIGLALKIEQTAPTQLWEPAVSVTAGNIRLSDGKYYSAEATGTTGTITPSHYEGVVSDGKINWRYIHSGYGYCRITAVGALTNGFATTATAVVEGELPNGTVTTFTTKTVTAYAVSAANPYWVRATCASHAIPDRTTVSYTAAP